MTSTVRSWSPNGRGPSPRLWGRMAQPVTGQLWQDPNYGWGFFDDFLTFYADLNRYNITADNSVALSSTILDGVLTMSTGGVDNNEAVIRLGLATGNNFVVDQGWGKLWFETRLMLSAVSDGGIFVGLVEEGGGAADTLVDNTCVVQDKDVIGFNVVSAAPTALTTVHNTAGGGVTTVSSSLDNGTLTALTWVKIGFRFDGEKTLTFFVDGVPDSTTVDYDATNFPNGEFMNVCFAVKTGAAADVSLHVDWFACAQQAV